MRDKVSRKGNDEKTPFDISNRLFSIDDNNIDELREKYANGLTFVVGDTHGELDTLVSLMDKIRFDKSKDHIYFVGDYNAGGRPNLLLDYISQYFHMDYSIPGFHLIRGNHERELLPTFPLENLPDIIAIRGETCVFFIVHAGMMDDIYDLIIEDIDKHPDDRVFSYALANNLVGEFDPYRQVVWSKSGFYQRARYNNVWPSEAKLKNRNAFIIHGHTPYVYMLRNKRFDYGRRNLFFTNQHVCFSEDLQSFNIDSNVKGRYMPGDDTYKGLSCICLEALDELSDPGNGITIDAVKNASNFVFGSPYRYCDFAVEHFDKNEVLNAMPTYKMIKLGANKRPYIDV